MLSRKKTKKRFFDLRKKKLNYRRNIFSYFPINLNNHYMHYILHLYFTRLKLKSKKLVTNNSLNILISCKWKYWHVMVTTIFYSHCGEGYLPKNSIKVLSIFIILFQCKNDFTKKNKNWYKIKSSMDSRRTA